VSQATIDGIPFRVNPTKVSWPYSIKMATHKTLGGKVFQLYGVSLGDLVIEGTFGAGGPREQQAFFDRINAIIDGQMPSDPSASPRPVRFYWASRGWDFWCYIKGIGQAGASTAVVLRNDIVAPEYRLTLFIQEDNGDIAQAAKDSAAAAFIGRITKGIGWKRTLWNGPEGYDELKSALSGTTVLDSIFSALQGDRIQPSDEARRIALGLEQGTGGID
jgi:hypothetical protein